MSAPNDDSPRALKRRRLDAGSPAKQSVVNTSINNTDIDTPSEQDDTLRQTRSSARQRRPPQRYEEGPSTPSRRTSNRVRQKNSTSRGSTPASTTVEATLQSEPDKVLNAATTSPLKGILTPSRRNRAQSRPRKTVVFDHDEAEIEQRLGFRDVDLSVKKQRPAPFSTASKSFEGVTDAAVIDDLEEEIVMQIDQPQIDEELGRPHNRSTRDRKKVTVDEEHSHVSTAKAAVLGRLIGAGPASLPVPDHLKQPYQTLHNLLTATVCSSESNSLLLLGPRGAGKTMLLEHAINDLAEQHGQDSFYAVRLSGFLQTDDRLALRETWRQFGKELTAGDSEEEQLHDATSSYADVMTSLLSLLSHPDEQLIEDENGVARTNGEDRVAKSTIFILDEFDLFTTHPRQTLLYNLFDIAQSRKAPIAVIGCSSRMDVVDGLEKRVKSRFSQRWVFVPPVRNLSDWEEVVRSILRVDTGKAAVDAVRTPRKDMGSIQQWNEYIDNTLLSSAAIQSLLRQHFYTTKSLPDLFMALHPIVATLDPSMTKPTSSSPQTPAVPTNTVYTTPSLLDDLKILPALPTSLLIAHCRLETIHCLPTTNFNLAYAHYTELVTRARTQQSAAGAISVSGSLRVWGRDVARRAWQELGEMGFLVSAHTGEGEGEGAGGESEDTRMWKGEVALEDVEWALRTREGSVSSVLGKWCREI